MDLFSSFSLILVVAALFSYLNHRLLRWPTTIGVMVFALLLSLALIALDLLGLHVAEWAEDFTEELHFRELLLDGMLAFLLFAGALHVDLGQLMGQKRIIAILATVGVVVTTLLVGFLTLYTTLALGFELPLEACFLFGALISPTDPIAVLGILKKAGVPHSLETKIVGESLFNDGIGVVVFGIVLGLAGGTAHAESELPVALLYVWEVLGSLGLGLVAGWVVYRMLRSVDNYQVEVLLTLALAMGLYTLAGKLHASGPLAVVVAGLLIGNTGRVLAMSESVAANIDTFWELVDEILNVVLFVLIGLEVLVLDFSARMLAAGALAIPLVLLARFVSVSGTVQLLKRFRDFTPHAIKIMTWGGLRGGISVALALSIPKGLEGRELILAMTYVVVVFSIIVQGLSVGRLARMIPAKD
jgi:CPA1 family monovalent cation:H+ antiporter